MCFESLFVFCHIYFAICCVKVFMLCVYALKKKKFLIFLFCLFSFFFLEKENITVFFFPVFFFLLHYALFCLMKRKYKCGKKKNENFIFTLFSALLPSNILICFRCSVPYFFSTSPSSLNFCSFQQKKTVF